MIETGTAPRKSGTPLWVRITLVVSLALNLAVVGMVAGAFYRFGGPPGPPPGPRSVGAALIMSLPRDERQVMREEMNSLRGPHKQDRDVLNEELPRAIRLTPIDVKKINTLVTSERNRILEWQAKSYQLWLDQLQNMEPEVRAAYADRLEKALERPSRKRHGPDKDRD